MKNLNTYYITYPNMGDHLNVLILENIFGYTPIRKTPINCKLSGIGSGLGKFCYADKAWLRTAEFFTGKIWPKVYVWGTGFMEYREDRPFFRKNMFFCATRGELSKKRVEKLIGKSLRNMPTCDGGILANELLNKLPEKKYQVGIIPHIKEQKENEFKELAARFEDSVIIDLLADPLGVVKQMAECEYIISSSLHGLIVADSFHIPNVHVKVTNNMMGDGFKYDDYFSGYGIEHLQFNAEQITDVNFIKDHWIVPENLIEKKKKQMKECFPYPILK